MTDIKILQGQFEEAAKRFPGLRHTSVHRSKEGLNPETTALEYEYGNIDPDADYYVYRWGEYIDREPNETGYPSWHFLSRPSPQVWSVRQVEGRALALAEEAGKCLIALPELKDLCIDDPTEYWFLALHKVYHNECERLTYDPPETEFHPTIPRLKLPGSWREAELGEAYIEELDNVFLKSAMLCGKLLASKSEAAEPEQRIAPAKEEKANLNIQIGGIQAENVQIGNHASIHKEAKADPAKKPAETERNTTPAKRERESWLWRLYEKTLKVIVDAVLERVWLK